MFGIKLWQGTGNQTQLEKDDVLWIREITHETLRCFEISVTRAGTTLSLGNDRHREKTMPLVSFSRFPGLDIHQAVLLLSDLLTLGGNSCVSHYTFGDGSPRAKIVIS
jgi:hypothetical protein